MAKTEFNHAAWREYFHKCYQVSRQSIFDIDIAILNKEPISKIKKRIEKYKKEVREIKTPI